MAGECASVRLGISRAQKTRGDGGSSQSLIQRLASTGGRDGVGRNLRCGFEKKRRRTSEPITLPRALPSVIAARSLPCGVPFLRRLFEKLMNIAPPTKHSGPSGSRLARIAEPGEAGWLASCHLPQFSPTSSLSMLRTRAHSA